MSYTYLCENSTCSPGQEAASLAECSSDTPQFALWKLNLTAGASYSNDNGTESCHDSQFGTTSRHSTPHIGADGLTSCAEVSHAKTFPPPEKAQALTAREADSGGTWPEWFAKFDPVTSSWKTRQCSLLAGLDAFSGTWPRWGMMRSGVCWELATPVRRIVENESGFWPTPQVSGRIQGKMSCKTIWKTCIQNGGQIHLTGHLRLMGVSLERFPSISDWMMGWPVGWSDLKPLETDRFRLWCRSHGAPSQDSSP
jgi:hypothetical protein